MLITCDLPDNRSANRIHHVVDLALAGTAISVRCWWHLSAASSTHLIVDDAVSMGATYLPVGTSGLPWIVSNGVPQVVCHPRVSYRTTSLYFAMTSVNTSCLLGSGDLRKLAG